MSVPATKDKDNKDIIATDEYQASLVAYREWCKKDRKARYTMLYCMHDDLIDEFEIYPTAKEMWDKIRLRYGQTLETRLCALSSQVPSSFHTVELCALLVCSHAFVANSFPNWIVDSGASKHVVQD